MAGRVPRENSQILTEKNEQKTVFQKLNVRTSTLLKGEEREDSFVQ